MEIQKQATDIVMKLLGVVVALAVVTGLVATVHTYFTNFIGNLTGATQSVASTIAGVIETIFWILLVLEVLNLAFGSKKK